MIGYSYYHVSINKWIVEKFGALLPNKQADVHFCPADNAKKERLNRLGQDPSRYLNDDTDPKEITEALEMPFISFWAEPVLYANELGNYGLSRLGTGTVIPDIGAKEVKGYPISLEYQIDYWDTDGARTSEFNKMWITLFPGFEVDITYPLPDEEETLMTKEASVVPENPVDNSDIERRFETGVESRLTANMTIDAVDLQINMDEDYYKIQEVLLNMYVKEMEDYVLVNEIIVT